MPRERSIHDGGDLRDWHRGLPGSLVLDLENSQLIALLSRVFGYRLLLVGSGDYLPVLGAARVQHRTWLMPPTATASHRGAGADCSSVRGVPGAMPVATDSVNVVVLPHVLEFEDEPYDALREAERVLAPEGHVIVVGYNAIGLMGAWNLLPHRGRRAPWNGRFYTAARVREWLATLGFDPVASEGCFFRPPLPSGRMLSRLELFEDAGSRFWPNLCGTWFLVARKRTATLTPLRPSWRRRREPIREAGLAGPAMTAWGRDGFPADDAA